MSELPKVVFFGSDAICLPVLNYLIGEGASACDLCAVISQPDRRQGRGKQLQPNPIAAWATERGVQLLQPDKPDEDLVEWMLAEQVVVALVMAYGHFLPKKLREAPVYGMVNFHGSILPKYRGASPVETALAIGETETGVCLMEIVREMDAGGVADVEKVRIDPADTGPSLRVKLGEAVVPLLRRNLEATLSGRLHFKAQNVDEVTQCRKLSKEDAALDFHQSAQAIYDRLRAFTPWPGGYFDHAETRIKVGAATVDLGAVELLPGTVVEVGESLKISTREGAICFHQLQRPGGRMMAVSDFMRGYPIVVGEVIASVQGEPLVD
ncbi:MAG TPA: methionyl-tRNA formyltransferase [Opitutae bacterium]|nr:methionyl-tRNA formyltransferase [Opitutae bacterium]